MPLLILIIVSAVLNIIPYVFSKHLWFTIFCVLMPLLYGSITTVVSFRAGFLWGFLVALLHGAMPLSYAASAFFEVTCLFQLILLVCLALYVGVHAGFFFFLAHHGSRIFSHGVSMHKYRALVRFVLYSVAITLFFIWLSDYSFWFCGRLEGFIFAHALIPLGQFPELMQTLVVYFGFNVTLFLLMVLQGACVLAWYERTPWSYGFLIICLAPWLWSYATSHKEYFFPAWHARVGCMSLLYRSACSAEIIVDMQHKIATYAQEHNKDIIFMPEAVISDAYEHHLQRMVFSAHVIFGVCHHTSRGYCNSLVYIQGADMRYQFDKQFLALFTERPPYISGNQERMPFIVDATIELVPYICSEFLYNQRPDDAYHEVPIVALCGNAWAAGSYIQDIFLLGACLRALQWQRDIVYISSSHGAFISKWGKRIEM